MHFFENIYIYPIIIYLMKRRVVLHGNSTLTISLPSSWVKRFSIQKGDELNVEAHGREIRVGTESNSYEKKEINSGDLKRVGKSYITSSYRQGYDEIDFTYEDKDYIETIQDLISKEITGFEVVRQQGNHCIIKDLTGQNEDEFGTALRRTWLLLLDLSEECINILKENKPSDLKSINMIDSSINKFTNYCLRILIKRGHLDFKKTPTHYHFVKNLEELADKYKELCVFYSNHPKETNRKLIDSFIKTNSHLNSIYKLFYKYDERKIEELLNETKITFQELSNFKDPLAIHLSFISRDIRNLLPLMIEINM